MDRRQSPDAGKYNGFWGVVRLSSGNAWAVGNWSNQQLNGGRIRRRVGRGDVGLSVAKTAYEHWDGSAWTMVAAPDPPKGRGEIDAISAGADGAISAGFYRPNIFGDKTRTLIEMCCS